MRYSNFEVGTPTYFWVSDVKNASWISPDLQCLFHALSLSLYNFFLKKRGRERKKEKEKEKKEKKRTYAISADHWQKELDKKRHQNENVSLYVHLFHTLETINNPKPREQNVPLLVITLATERSLTQA